MEVYHLNENALLQMMNSSINPAHHKLPRLKTSPNIFAGQELVWGDQDA